MAQQRAHATPTFSDPKLVKNRCQLPFVSMLHSTMLPKLLQLLLFVCVVAVVVVPQSPIHISLYFI